MEVVAVSKPEKDGEQAFYHGLINGLCCKLWVTMDAVALGAKSLNVGLRLYDFFFI